MTVVVKNEPTAGGIVALNKLYRAQPDGLTISIINPGLVFSQILEQDGVQYDLARLSWIGKAASEPRALLVSAKSPYYTLEDLLAATEPITFAASGPASQNYIESSLVAKALGIEHTIAPGFGSRDRKLAMIQGTATAITGSYSSNKELIIDGHARPIVQTGAPPDHPLGAYPSSIPYITKAFGPSIGRLVENTTVLMRMTAGPPGIEPSRLAVLRDAYLAALADPGLLAEAEKMKRPIAALDGETVAALVRDALDIPPDSAEMLRTEFRRQ